MLEHFVDRLLRQAGTRLLRDTGQRSQAQAEPSVALSMHEQHQLAEEIVHETVGHLATMPHEVDRGDRPDRMPGTWFANATSRSAGSLIPPRADAPPGTRDRTGRARSFVHDGPVATATRERPPPPRRARTPSEARARA